MAQLSSFDTQTLALKSERHNHRQTDGQTTVWCQ